MKWKSRHELESFKGVEKFRIGVGSTPIVYNYDASLKTMEQKTQSQNNGFGRYLSESREFHRTFKKYPLNQADVGGPFYTVRNDALYGNYPVTLHDGTSTSSVEHWYSGELLAYTNQPLFPPAIPYTDIQMYGFGNKARSLVNPVNPAVSAGQDIGELRDLGGYPSLPGSAYWRAHRGYPTLAAAMPDIKERIRVMRALPGSEYLNVVFGWEPIISDLRASAIAAKETVKLLRQYERNRGKPVRRRFAFPVVVDGPVETDMGNSHSPYPPISSAFYNRYFGNLHMQRTTTSQVWFSGSFTYYVTPGISPGKLAKYEAAANKLLSSRLTPELVWQLTPWSWLTDWFFDIGAFIGNLDAMILDGSVMWYGYVMANRRTSDVYTLSGYGLKNHDSPVLHQVFSTETKQRVRATPFGFGLSPNTFSMKQWSILAALGISRA
jgi:hypothetical protein